MAGLESISIADLGALDLIATYNPGGTIHFGTQRPALVDLTKDPTHAAYYTYACMLAIIGLTHTYFGFAVLLDSAMSRDAKAYVVDGDVT